MFCEIYVIVYLVELFRKSVYITLCQYVIQKIVQDNKPFYLVN